MRGLCPRLLAVYHLVPAGTTAVDIGCDSGRLALHLASGRCPRVIAIDSNPHSVLLLRREVERLGLSDRIEVRRGDGLALDPGEADVVSVSGLGGDSITAILSRWREVVPLAQFVLQPMSRAADVRRWASREGLLIVNERLARYGKRIYQAMLLRDGGLSYQMSSLACELGPVSLANRHPLLGDLARQEFDRRRARHDEASELLAELEIIARPTETGGR